MQFLKEFKFKNGFTLKLDFENGNLFYTVTNGKCEYKFFSKDTLKTVGYYNTLGSDIELEEGDFFIADIIGLPVFDVDTGKKYGKIKDADFDRHTPLYTIETENGDVLFPAIDEFVKEIDIERGVKIRPIAGFFDEV